MTDAFAVEWVAAWNRHDLDAVLTHDADDVVFTPPFGVRPTGDGTVRGTDALRDYFAAALSKFPDSHFRLRHALSGVNSLVLVYDSVEDLPAAEAFEFDARGKVGRVNGHYAWTVAEARP
ncbi:nuclear transport factor 2 family protein [Gemmata sp.]|uniref:nuclear transport factor 2 family protein n=1 Tax=Gemmata sp. TaxID=1914242 RepID=UPI003F717267